MSRILIHEPRPASHALGSMLAARGDEIVVCRDRHTLLDALIDHRPDLVVYVLNAPLVDLAVLSLLRRVAPSLPLILLGGPAGLEARRSVQDLNPTYFGVLPLEAHELTDAVSGALDRHRHALAS
jgi:DNA-binding response OmpR family regulator